jgi:hypothetical protein
MSNSPIDTQEIVRLYVDEELSVRDIATRYRCSYGRIYNLLRARVVMRSSNRSGRRQSTLYLQIAEVMRERIVTGDWPPNRKILSQEDLAKIFGVRHQVIREAELHLRERGYLTVKSRGTYVRPRQDWECSS